MINKLSFSHCQSQNISSVEITYVEEKPSGFAGIVLLMPYFCLVPKPEKSSHVFVNDSKWPQEGDISPIQFSEFVYLSPESNIVDRCVLSRLIYSSQEVIIKIYIRNIFCHRT